MSDSPIKFIPGMPWRLVDGVRLPDLDTIRATPHLTPYTASQFGARPKLRCDPDTALVAPEFKDECDINTIMRRYTKTGVLPAGNGPGNYGDFSNITDYLDAYNQVLYAQQSFEQLPALLRERFKNNPGELLAFLADPANRDEAVKLGLVNPPAQATATPATEAKTNDPTNKPAT